MRFAEIIRENVTTADIPVVNYDRNYGGDINKVLAVKPNAQADAQAIYNKLGGITNANYEKLFALGQAKIQELRNVYRNAVAKKGLKGAAALKSPEYLLFRKQSNDLKIMSSTAMDMMLKAVSPNASSATSTGSFAKANFRSASVIAQITQGTDYQVGRYLLIHDGTTVTTIEESAIATNSMLGTFEGVINSANVEFRVTMSSSSSATVITNITTIAV